MASIRIIGWTSFTEETVADVVTTDDFRTAIKLVNERYGNELSFVIALDDSLSIAGGFAPVGRYEGLPDKPGLWREKTGSGSRIYSILGFSFRRLAPLLDYYEAPEWSLAAQSAMDEYRHQEYRFVAAFAERIDHSAILGSYQAPDDKWDAAQ